MPSLRNLFMKTHARSGRTDDLRQGLLAEPSEDRPGPGVLSVIREKKEKSRKALLTRIEQLVDGVFCRETFLKFGLFMHDGHYHRLIDAGNQAVIDRRSRCSTQRAAVETTFSEE